MSRINRNFFGITYKKICGFFLIRLRRTFEPIRAERSVIFFEKVPSRGFEPLAHGVSGTNMLRKRSIDVLDTVISQRVIM